MQTLDLIIIFGYLIGITLFGIFYSGKQETTKDYFVGDRNVPWWAIAASIVATETSTITFISVPGIAFAKNGNFEFLQLVFGYMLGRVVISLLFIPMYFKGELFTVYQLLGDRFGEKVKMLASGLFVIMRNIADGIRLLLTAIVLAATYVLPTTETNRTCRPAPGFVAHQFAFPNAGVRLAATQISATAAEAYAQRFAMWTKAAVLETRTVLRVAFATTRLAFRLILATYPISLPRIAASAAFVARVLLGLSPRARIECAVWIQRREPTVAAAR